MGTGQTPTKWEDMLDRELSGLVGAPASGEEDSSAPPPTDPPQAAPDSAADANDRSITVSQFRTEILRSIRAGMTLSDDICDESGVLLLAAGSQITPRFLQLLNDRRIARVRLRPAHPAHVPEPTEETLPEPAEDDLHTPTSRQLDERMAGELQTPVHFRPVKRWRRPRLSVDALKNEASRGLEKHTVASTAVADICQALTPGREISTAELRRTVDHFVNLVAIDFDLLPFIVSLQQSKDEYLYDHCVNVALLSMAMASQLGLHRQVVAEIGLGGLLQDIGMLRVPESIRLAPRSLNTREWHEIHRHPLHTLDMLAGCRNIPPSVRFIGYQAHERFDATGYPRGRSGSQVHIYAQIVSLADSFAACTRPRPYRKPLSPYLAVKTMLMEGADHKFDRKLLRSFLDTVSLFPIGSRVELDNGRTAQVLRANPDLHTQPVVEELTNDGSASGHIVDLSEEGAPRVIKAL